MKTAGQAPSPRSSSCPSQSCSNRASNPCSSLSYTNRRQREVPRDARGATRRALAREPARSSDRRGPVPTSRAPHRGEPFRNAVHRAPKARVAFARGLDKGMEHPLHPKFASRLWIRCSHRLETRSETWMTKLRKRDICASASMRRSDANMTRRTFPNAAIITNPTIRIAVATDTGL
jgi:hypothetical protein